MPTENNNALKLGIVVPCYNEEEVLTTTIERLLSVLNDLEQEKLISINSFIYLVDDGSLDKTFEIIKEYNKKTKKVKGLKFTRNYGNQCAILAGLLGVRKLNVDCAITIDADLQQDENLIREFILKYKEGYEIVFGVRKIYKIKNPFKKLASALFYKTMGFLGAKIIPNHSEYRLTGKKALEALSNFKEYDLFLRSVFTEMGFKTTKISYNTKARMAGTTKFKFTSLLRLAVNGITSFSIVPLRLVAILGIILTLLSFGVGLEVIWEKLYLKNTIPGWTTLVVCICFFSGIQIFCLGIISEYLGQIFREVKSRPRYIEEVELI